MATYHDGFERRDDIVANYGDKTPTEDELVYAGYTCEDYEGSAIVVFVRDGKWFENNDGHCSCNGLENWEPEETSPEALLIRAHWPGLHEAVTARMAMR